MKNTDQTEQNQTQNIILSEQCLREIADHSDLLELYSVRCFAVIRGGADKTNNYQLISPWLATQEQAMVFLAQSKAQYQDSKVTVHETFFTSKHEEGRQELLAKIVH